jgi:hypothetical protein
VAREALHLRAGLRWDAVIPRDRIVSIEQLHPEPKDINQSALQMKVLGPPNMRLRTRGPVAVQGLYGIQRWPDDIYFTVDDPAGFLSAWNAPTPTPID